MFLFYFATFFLTSVLSLFFSYGTIFVAKKLGIVDRPDEARKLHHLETPLMGGVAIFLSFFLIIFLFNEKILSGNLEWKHWLGVFIGALFLVIGGVLDDKYNLKPGKQIIFPILAIFSVLVGGVGIAKITNPFGGFLFLENLNILSSAIIFIWLLGMMYTTKLLDGVDGLVSGVAAIGGFIIFLFTITTKYYQPDIGFAALVFSGACFGFLILNWHPAKIFLGESGSLLLGFILGVLAIISGGKIAIALLVMGLPIMDVAWIIIRRLKEGKNPFKFGDRKHLHHRLLDLGIGPKKTVLIFYAFSTFFGLAALFLQSRGKLLALTLLLVIMFGMVYFFEKMERK